MGDWRAQGQGIRRRQGAPSAHTGGAVPDSLYPNVPESMRGRVHDLMTGATKSDPVADAYLHLGEAKRLRGMAGRLPDRVIHSNRVAHQNAAARARRGER